VTKPVPVLPDRATHDMRNTARGDNLFAYHPFVVAAFMFIVATASRRFNVGIVAYALMPNHIHIIIRPFLDPDRPSDPVEFRKFLRSNFARCINAYWRSLGFDTCGSVMCRDSTGNTIQILDAETELANILYVEMNGMRAGLETRPEFLKGAMSMRRWLTTPVMVTRPLFWFQSRSWEEQEVLQLCLPPKVAATRETVDQFQARSQRALNRAIQREHGRRRTAGLKSRRLSALQQQMPTMRPGRSAADYSETLVTGNDPEVVAQELHNIRAFRVWHADARRRTCEGEEDVLFPPGTYQAVVRYGVRVADEDYWEATVKRGGATGPRKRYAERLE
jgi:hypothetical protein